MKYLMIVGISIFLTAFLFVFLIQDGKFYGFNWILILISSNMATAGFVSHLREMPINKPEN